MFRRSTATVALLALTACTLPEGFGQDLWDVAKLAAHEYAQTQFGKQADRGTSLPAPTDAPTDAPTGTPTEAPTDAPIETATEAATEAPPEASAPPAADEPPPPAPEPASPELIEEPVAAPPPAAPTRKVRRAEELRLRALKALRKLGPQK